MVGLMSLEDTIRRQPLRAWDDIWAKDLSVWLLWQEWKSRWGEDYIYTFNQKQLFFTCEGGPSRHLHVVRGMFVFALPYSF